MIYYLISHVICHVISHVTIWRDFSCDDLEWFLTWLITWHYAHKKMLSNTYLFIKLVSLMNITYIIAEKKDTKNFSTNGESNSRTLGYYARPLSTTLSLGWKTKVIFTYISCILHIYWYLSLIIHLKYQWYFIIVYIIYTILIK